MRLRSHLLMLVAGTMLPVLALTAYLAFLLVEHEKETFRRGAMDRNRTFMTAIDSELHGHIRSLQALAATPALARGDLDAFHDAAERVLRSQPDWRNVLLFHPDTSQLVNLRVPRGASLPRTIEVETVKRALATRKPAIGDVSRGPLGDSDFALPIRLPVIRDGEVAYVLSAIIRLDRFAQIMAQQRYPDGWAIGLVDSVGVFLTRIPATPAGQRASADFWAAIQRAREGWFRGRTLEGVDTYTAYLTSEVTGWTVGVAVPTAQVYATAYRAAWTIAIGGLGGLVLALGFAYWMGRRIAAPITNLAAATHALGGADGVLRSGPASIDEVRELADALQDRERLRQSEQIALKAADKAKDEFLAMLGHELRNPLSAISMAAHLLRLSKPDAQAALQAHGVLERQTQQMTRLIQDLLDVSRLAMGKVTLQREALELGEFAERVGRTWEQGRGRRPGAALHIRASAVWVNADRARMEQAICNLLDNADKFSPPAASIELRVFPQDGQAVLEVEDHGEGIPAEMLGRIFDLFVQGPQSSDRARGGMGLGLTLVKRLVELHGGSIEAFSDGPGAGARFVARLPAVTAAEATPPRVQHRETLGDKRRILLVEDNDDGRAMLEALLLHEGHTVRAVRDGAQAVAMAASGWPEVAILDIGLPDIDGYEVARRIRAGGAQISLIALTGYGQERDQRRAYEAGFDLHLTKPVEATVLREALAVLTAKRRALDASRT